MTHLDRLNAGLKAHTAASIDPAAKIVNEHLTTFDPDNFRNNMALAQCMIESAREAKTDRDAYDFIQAAIPLLTAERNKIDDHLRANKI